MGIIDQLAGLPGVKLYWSRDKSAYREVHYLEAVHTEALDGTDELHGKCLEDVRKGHIVRYERPWGGWCEFVVDSAKRGHRGGDVAMTEFVAVNRICDLYGEWIDFLLVAGSPRQCLDTLMAGSAYKAGAAATLDWDDLYALTHVTPSNDFEFRSTSRREALATIQDYFQLEIEAYRDTNGDLVVDLVKRGTSATPKHEFVLASDMSAIEYDEASDDIITDCYAWGQTYDTETLVRRHTTSLWLVGDSSTESYDEQRDSYSNNYVYFWDESRAKQAYDGLVEDTTAAVQRAYDDGEGGYESGYEDALAAALATLFCDEATTSHALTHTDQMGDEAYFRSRLTDTQLRHYGHYALPASSPVVQRYGRRVGEYNDNENPSDDWLSFNAAYYVKFNSEPIINYTIDVADYEAFTGLSVADIALGDYVTVTDPDFWGEVTEEANRALTQTVRVSRREYNLRGKVSGVITTGTIRNALVRQWKANADTRHIAQAATVKTSDQAKASETATSKAVSDRLAGITGSGGGLTEDDVEALLQRDGVLTAGSLLYSADGLSFWDRANNTFALCLNIGTNGSGRDCYLYLLRVTYSGYQYGGMFLWYKQTGHSTPPVTINTANQSATMNFDEHLYGRRYIIHAKQIAGQGDDIETDFGLYG